MCEKCNQRRLFAERFSDGSIGEVWSGVISGEKRWFNVGKLKAYFAAVGGVGPEYHRDVSVDMLWRDQVSLSYIVTGHLPHVDMSDPVILVTTAIDIHGANVTLVDGIHRIARGHAEGRETLKAIICSVEMSKSIEVPAEVAVLEELATEIIATGGKIGTFNGAIVFSGGSPRPQSAEDHPLRGEYLKAIMTGPLSFDLPFSNY